MMELMQAMQHRRSRYALDSTSPISDEHIEKIVGECLKYTPSAFHTESARVIALFGASHAQLWNIVKETLAAVVPADRFAATEAKLAGFAAAHATLLFYEDQDIVASMQRKFPTYADNFPLWSLQSSGMVQYAIWTALSAEGLGVNIQHYNPLIDAEVAKTFGAQKSWKLWSQMVIGNPVAEPDALDYAPMDQRLFVRR